MARKKDLLRPYPDSMPLPDDLWAQSKRAFLIGGGPSLAYAAGVQPGEDKYKAISRFLEPIHAERIIGVNNSYMLGPRVDALWFGDCNWFIYHETKLKSFTGLKMSCCPRFSGNPRRGVIYLSKDREKKRGITTRRGSVAWNYNSGGSAINVAYHLGVKEIVLLGFDMQNGPSRTTHWHGGHKQGIGAPDRTKKARHTDQAPYHRFLSGFPDIKIDADKLGLTIINAVHPATGSAITCFETVPIEEVLRW